MLVILIALASVTAWIKWYNRPVSQPVKNTGTGPDYYLKNFTITATGKDGSPRHRIKASYMEYISGQETVMFIQPQLLFHNENQLSWTVTGEQAQVSEHGKRIMMEGKVTLKQLSETGIETIRVNTADLLVLPDQNFAKSDARVTVKTEHSAIIAIGLRADMKQAHLEFLHQVKGEFSVPPS